MKTGLCPWFRKIASQYLTKSKRLSCIQSRDALMNGGTESLNKVQLEFAQGKVWRQEEAAYNPKQTTL